VTSSTPTWGSSHGRERRSAQLSAVWFLAEGDTIALSLNTARQKTKNLKAKAVATLFILDRRNPYRYLEVRGDATIEPDDNYAFADRVGAKYQANVREHDGSSDRRVKVEDPPPSHQRR
jgi:PPOX class probable F420-dependent enzyme